MRTVLQTLLVTVLFSGLFYISSFAAEEGKVTEENRNIVFALDDSGSMRVTDKSGLSKLAAEMFIKLMDGGDNLAVVAFSSDASLILKSTRLADDDIRKYAIQKTNSLSRSGRITNIESSLRKSLPLFPEKAGDSQALLLLSDGKIDLDNNGKQNEVEVESRKRILGEIISEYKSRHIPIYSIAFGNDADVELLRSISLESGGLFFKLDSAEQITKVYFTIFNQYKAPQLAFVQEGVFTIDKAVTEATLLVQGDMREKELVLQSPSDREYSSLVPTPEARWAINTGYTMITLSRPEVGEWSLRGVQDDEAKIILITNIKLDAPFRRVNYYQDEPIYVVAQIDAAELPQSVKIEMRIFAELINSEGAVMKSIELFNNGASDGICVENMIDRWNGGYFAGVFLPDPPLEEGLYVIRVRATTHTFNRERQYSIRIHSGNWISLASGDINAEEGRQIAMNATFNAAPFWSCLADQKQVPPCETVQATPIAFTLKTPSGESIGLQYSRQSEKEYEIKLPEISNEGEYTIAADMIQSAESLVCLSMRRNMPFHFKLTKLQDISGESVLGTTDSEKNQGFGSLRVIIILAVAVLVGIAVAAVLLSRESRRRKAGQAYGENGSEEGESVEEEGSILERQARRKGARKKPDDSAAVARKVGSSAIIEAQPGEELEKLRLRREGQSAIDDLLGELTRTAGDIESSTSKPSSKPIEEDDSVLSPKSSKNKEETEAESETGKDGKKKYKTAREMSSLDKAISRLERKAKVLQQKAPEEEEPKK